MTKKRKASLDKIDKIDKINKTNKTKDINDPELDNFINTDELDDDYEPNCSYNNHPLKKKIKREAKIEKEIDKLIKLSEDREITYEQIINLNLPDDEKIWFIEHIQILENTEPYTEERFRIKNMIYEKYMELQKNNDSKLIIEHLKKLSNTTDNMLSKIIASNHTDEIKAICYKKYMNIIDIQKSDEYFKVIECINTILDIPTECKPIDNNDDIGIQLIKLKKLMNDKLYGLDNVKEKILETYCAMIGNPNYKKKFIALVGPPGVGKTAIAHAIAESMNLPFNQISLGGIKDASSLTGQSTVYIGSKPGMFVNILKRVKILNSVVLLDEIDKIENTVEGSSINSVLLHVLDNTQNNRFQDMYMPEVTIDLSNILFVLAMNDADIINPILKDRLHIIRIDGYSIQDKINIGTNYILPKILSSLGFSKKDIIIPSDNMRYLVEQYCNVEPGVRELERVLSSLCERLNILKYSKNLELSYSIDNLKFPIKITNSIIDNLVGK
jgi:ATP-dependent Lon protease